MRRSLLAERRPKGGELFPLGPAGGRPLRLHDEEEDKPKHVQAEGKFGPCRGDALTSLTCNRDPRAQQHRPVAARRTAHRGCCTARPTLRQRRSPPFGSRLTSNLLGDNDMANQNGMGAPNVNMYTGMNGGVMPSAGHYSDMQTLMQNMENLSGWLEQNRQDWALVQEGLAKVERLQVCLPSTCSLFLMAHCASTLGSLCISFS